MNRVTKVLSHLKDDIKDNNTPQNTFQSSLHTNNINNQSSGFIYTLDSANQFLTKEQRASYDKNGFIVIKKLLNSQEVKTFYDRFDELVSNPKERPQMMTVVRDIALKGLKREDRNHEGVVTKLQQWAHDRVLWKFAKHKLLIKYIESIVGSDIRAHHFMVINKPKDPGQLSSRHPLHQDQWYFPFAPSKYIVCAWTALEHVHRGNGCLCVVPGSHRPENRINKGTLLPHSYPKQWIGPVNKAYHGIQFDGDVNSILSQRVHLDMQPGDTVLFHPLLVHGSGANLSKKNRRSISVHYANSKLCEFVEGGVIPEQKVIREEVEALTKKMAGRVVPYDVVWKIKSRQVKGDQGCFRMRK